VIRLAVRVRRSEAETVLAELLELVPAGVEEGEPEPGVVEYAIYGAPGELPRLPDLRAAAGAALVEVSTSEVADDWSERWRRFHRPTWIESPAPTAPALYVRPPWEDSLARAASAVPPVAAAEMAAPRAIVPAPASPAAVEEIVIDPGQAFGTGAHSTTRLCLQLLLEIATGDRARGSLLDLGTGSGVLAIAAARLGFAPVLGLDHEAESVAAALANAKANEVEIEARRLDLRRQALPQLVSQQGVPRAPNGDGAAAPVVLANLLFPLLTELTEKLAQVSPRQLVVSGLLREQVDELVALFCDRLALRERRRLYDGEWGAAWLAPV
jgi:ribosomal protein L11 methyltransferase